MQNIDYKVLADEIKSWAKEFDFLKIGISGVDLSADEKHMDDWLDSGFHGSLDYMEKHGHKRSRPIELEPWTKSVISVSMSYLAPNIEMEQVLQNSTLAYISRYTLGRDYHKVLKKKLTALAKKIQSVAGDFQFRVFVDSAPVLERALAVNAGIGWVGKNSLLINKSYGSFFFLGEIYCDLPLPSDKPIAKMCGTCEKCMSSCPTGAIVGPYKIDARKCISYLTIENKGAIPLEFRAKIGNRIFGCDDCQIVCPWSKNKQYSTNSDFSPRNNLDKAELKQLFCWSAEDFDKNTQGMSMRRAGYEGWLRNIAVALGNAPKDLEIIELLSDKKETASELVREHIEWALEQQLSK